MLRQSANEKAAHTKGLRWPKLSSARSLAGNRRSVLRNRLSQLLGREGKVCDDFGLSRLQWRRTGTALLQKATAAKFQVLELCSYVLETFGHKVSESRHDTLQDGLTNLQVHLATGLTQVHSEQSASIRRAKGLGSRCCLGCRARSRRIEEVASYFP
jgi:hypothetical protein